MTRDRTVPGWCGACRVAARPAHWRTARHARTVAPAVERRSRLSLAIRDGGRPAWIVALRREDNERPAETWVADAEHGAFPIPHWYDV